MTSKRLISEFRKAADKKSAKLLSGFFKTGKGQYGEGDIFWGIKVPATRNIARNFVEMPFFEIQLLLNHKVHEIRFAGLIILIEKYKKTDDKGKKVIFDLYLKNIKKNINNWDLVDLSCPQIIGDFLFEKDRSILYKLSKSDNIWERRVAMISTFYFIRKNDFSDALLIAENLLKDKQDLINKAVGWMLREIGKRNLDIERKFLLKNYKIMSRTCLRYAIERMNEKERKFFLKK